MSVKNRINSDNVNHEDSLITCKAAIPSILDTLKQILIPVDVYGTYVSHYYDDIHVEFLNP